MDAVPGDNRAGGARSQGMLVTFTLTLISVMRHVPTLARPHRGREDAVPGDERSRGAHSQGVLVLFTTVIRRSVGVTLGFEGRTT